MTETIAEMACDTAELAPSLAQTYHYWADLRQGKIAPYYELFHLDDLPPSIVPWTSMVDVVHENETLDFRFRFWGTKRRELVGTELTGKLASEIENQETRKETLATYQSIVQSPRAVIRSMQVFSKIGLDLTIGFMRLPLLDKEGKVARIVSILDYSSVTAGHYRSSDNC